jgi:hypothetical protein
MNLSLIWVRDPKDDAPSVSLTVLVVSLIYLVTMGALQALGKIQDVGIATEFFGVSSGLYFGRRLSFSKTGTDVSSDQKQEEVK